MRFLRYLAVLSVLALPFAVSKPAQAQVSVGIGVGVPAYGPPVCHWGYYNYAPYACAPYGYYGPEWFNGGLFIGAGPWYHGGWGYGGAYRGAYYGRGGYYGGGYHGYAGGYSGGYHGAPASGGYHGSPAASGSFHAQSSGGGSFHGGGGGSHGGHR